MMNDEVQPVGGCAKAQMQNAKPMCPRHKCRMQNAKCRMRCGRGIIAFLILFLDNSCYKHGHIVVKRCVFDSGGENIVRVFLEVALWRL